ncbi:uncharacterized protein PITG_14990 [Phytophthora infestans T30-4]|uniref:Uncharacterized protein n=2 Tax=Phytophthora infestans TaxID=4787 RepID=D0NPH7_PHYIT|nr:uncharacterized protein PITG_14990 [Phytophthora infestans T30-4]EEY62519.1 hypothetical protein PITG_14990 [Phytophthora infestans T30-4]KAF4143043.1 hypothetical protein GN958_ATG07772 [Phytophthora infestans]|eukprot:XP_002899155.1 hypothetical protein PITG_14990 [Phytophthora infestans T30-4]
MEHQDNVARLISEMPRARSPRRRTQEIQHAPHAAPMIKPLAKPLVFRKTKRELEREQQQAQARKRLERMERDPREYQTFAPQVCTCVGVELSKDIGFS